MGGQFNTWSQRDANTQSANDAGENPTLASCNEPIVRVVPNDTSGMTQAVLSGGPDDGTSTCTPLAPILLDWTALWNDLATQGNNDLWPGEDGSEGHPGDTWPVISDQSGCSGVTQSGQPGDASLLQILHNKAGGVGYASVADIKHDTSTNSGSGQYEATLVTFKVAYYETTAFTSATTRGGASNCDVVGTSELPGTSGADFVDLDDDWTIDIGLPGQNPGNAADYDFSSIPSNGYPMCTFTWDLV